MADIVLDSQAPPATPAAGQAVLYVCTRTKKHKTRDDAGSESTLGGQGITSAAAVAAAFAADTYMAGSPIAIPNSLLRVGSTYKFVFDMTKTGAGVAAPTISVRIGTLGTVVDTARVVFTFGVGTAVIDAAIFELWLHMRAVGAASAVMTGMARCTHHLAATGMTTTGASGTGIILATSAAFDSTVANSIIGVSFNGGLAFSGTNTVQQAQLDDA